MIYVKGLRLRNWMCHRSVELELEPKAYAVVARRGDDPDRSNYGGKSALFEALFFALSGRLNADRGMAADDWISDGEDAGEVEVLFSDGTSVSRSRRLGKSTKLVVNYKGAKSAGDEAQCEIDNLMGMSADDALETWYFQQRKMARFILSPPGKRMEIASTWFGLQKLEDGEDVLAKEASALRLAVEARDVRVRELRATLERVGDPKEARRQVEEGAARIEDLRAIMGRLQEEAATADRASGAQGLVDEVDRWTAEAAQLQARLDADHGELLEDVAEDATKKEREAYIQRVEAESTLKKRLSVAQGEFDGRCPVAKIECPATEKINGMRVESKKAAGEAREDLEKIATRHDKLKADCVSAVAALKERERLADRIENLRKQARRALPEYEEAKRLQGKAKDPAKIRAQIDALTADHSAALTAVAVARQALADHGAASAALPEQEKALEGLRARLRAVLAAARIFGKNGAQRRVAEVHLGAINDEANALLADAEVGLDFELRWSREGDGLAKSCDECGAAYPTSQKIKSCERCGAKRGPHLVNRLDILLSEQSSGAEDIVGVAFQLAASRWLLSQRSSEWSSVIVDEPFAHCDKFNRLALARQLVRVLSGERSPFRQAMVVSHTSDVTEMFPGRIEVVRGPEGSTARVIA